MYRQWNILSTDSRVISSEKYLDIPCITNDKPWYIWKFHRKSWGINVVQKNLPERKKKEMRAVSQLHQETMKVHMPPIQD